jgi:hypothetical protein
VYKISSEGKSGVSGCSGLRLASGCSGIHQQALAVSGYIVAPQGATCYHSSYLSCTSNATVWTYCAHSRMQYSLRAESDGSRVYDVIGRPMGSTRSI